jgi:SAM-dependent methyltransferase
LAPAALTGCNPKRLSRLKGLLKGTRILYLFSYFENNLKGAQMPPSKDISPLTNATRQHWDAFAPYHRQTNLWSQLTQGFLKKDYSVLDNILTSSLVSCGVSDAKLVQISCNNGREILSTFTLGTRVGLGIDQSAPFVEGATKLHDISGHNCQFSCCDIYNLPPDTDTDFDIALITIGVFNWMPDLAIFFAVVAKLLRPGSRLIIYETHPVLEMFDPECPTPQTPMFSYFRQEPHIL